MGAAAGLRRWRQDRVTELERIEQVLIGAGVSAADRAWMVASCPSVAHAEVYAANHKAPAVTPIAGRRRERTTMSPLGKLVEEVERRHRQIADRIAAARRMPFSPITEARVMSTLIVHEWALPASPDLEVSDFVDLRYLAMFAAMRALEARGAPHTGVAVVDELRCIDRREERHVTDAGGVTEYFVGVLVLEYLPYSEAEWADNLRWLRELAWLRRSL